MKPDFDQQEELSQGNDQQEYTQDSSFNIPFEEPKHEVDEWNKDSQSLGGRRYND